MSIIVSKFFSPRIFIVQNGWITSSLSKFIEEQSDQLQKSSAYLFFHYAKSKQKLLWLQHLLKALIQSEDHLALGQRLLLTHLHFTYVKAGDCIFTRHHYHGMVPYHYRDSTHRLKCQGNSNNWNTATSRSHYDMVVEMCCTII